jgi:glycosyltransferase involved in cell wall biosynthesis
VKILHTINSVRPSGGGPIEGIKQLSAIMVKSGHTVEIASLDAPEDADVKAFPLPVYALGPGRLRFAYSTRFVPWLRENADGYDVVVVNGIWQYQCFGSWLALHRSTTPYVVFAHGMLDPWFKRAYPLKHIKKWMYWPWANYRSLRDARLVVFTCDEERVLARQSFWLYRVREAVVSFGTAGPSGNGTLQRDAFLSRYPELRNRRLALFMGRIHEKKGCDLLIRAYAQSLAVDPDWQLVIAGPDEVGLQSELESLARKLGIDHRITWTGMISGDLKWGAIRSSEVFVLPSHQENFGIAVAEALACGVPVLISDKVNIWREVREDGAGLVATDDLSGTCRMLAQWARMSAGDRAALAANARPCFLRRFEIEAAAKSLIQTLTLAVEGRA